MICDQLTLFKRNLFKGKKGPWFLRMRRIVHQNYLKQILTYISHHHSRFKPNILYVLVVFPGWLPCLNCSPENLTIVINEHHELCDVHLSISWTFIGHVALEKACSSVSSNTLFVTKRSPKLSMINPNMKLMVMTSGL